MKVHLAQGQTTLAWLWKVKRLDGVILGFTTHDQDIVYNANDGDGAVTYLAKTGLTNSATAGKTDLSVENMEVTAFLDSPSITEADIRALKYDNAAIAVRIVNWADLTVGDVLMRCGTLGVVKMQNGRFTAELRGLASKLTANIGSTYGPICRSTFGSGLNGIDTNSTWLCMFDVTTVRQTGSLASVADNRTLVPAAGLAGAAGWFADGFITFTSGALNGASFEIKTWDGTTLVLFLSMPSLPAAGDTFTIEPGCNKTADNCQNKFSNIIHRHAEDFIPGMDQLLDNPSVS